MSEERREAMRQRAKAQWTPERRAAASAAGKARHAEGLANGVEWSKRSAEREAVAAGKAAALREVDAVRSALGLTLGEWIVLLETVSDGLAMDENCYGSDERLEAIARGDREIDGLRFDIRGSEQSYDLAMLRRKLVRGAYSKLSKRIGAVLDLRLQERVLS